MKLPEGTTVYAGAKKFTGEVPDKLKVKFAKTEAKTKKTPKEEVKTK